MGDIAAEIMEALDAMHPAHAGHRRQHARGVLMSGEFTPTPQAGELSRAAHFAGPPVRVTARFSNGGGDPFGPDNDRQEGRGLAVKFYLPDGATTDLVALTIPVFPVRTARDFRDFVLARVPDPATGKPDFDKLGAFVGEHPETMAAVGAILPALTPPRSYATRAYNSLHAFWLVDADGSRQAVRWRWEPEAGEHDLAEDEIDGSGADYLRAEILERGDVAFRLHAVLAGPDDPLDDPTTAWPPDRPRVEMGRMVLDGPDSSRERDGDVLVFDPTRVTGGVELTDDEILRVRSDVYALSVLRRSGVARAV